MAVGTTVLWPVEDQTDEASLIRSCIIERSGQDKKILSYRLPAQRRLELTDQADPFVIAAIFLAMQQNTDLVVHGTVSPSLLQNLREFQAAWVTWRPDRYACIDVKADIEREPAIAASPQTALAAFSGGVDSSFTVFYHKANSGARRRVDLRAAIMVHGFDIPLHQTDIFDRAANHAEVMLNSLDLDLIPVATNFRELKLDWKDCFAAAAVSCLTLFQAGYGTAFLGSSEPYSSLILPWGSNPITDHLLSSAAFRVVHDGAAFTRTEKIREIAQWPEAMQYLRVCWEGELLDRNCGRCEKCIRTILNFRASGMSLPPCFSHDIADADVLKIKGVNEAQLAELRQIAAAAKNASIKASWVTALERCIRRNERRHKFARYIPKRTIENLLNAVPWRLRKLLNNKRVAPRRTIASTRPARDQETRSRPQEARLK
jgi:hypothetical protein